MDELKRALNQCITVSELFLSLPALYIAQVFRATTFGKSPRQVTVECVGQWCRRTQRLIALRRNIWLERLTEERRGKSADCREWYETRIPSWSFLLNWTPTVQTCCLEPVLNTGAQACSKAFWRPRESHPMTSWCLGRSRHCPVLSVKGQKSILPETRWREVEDSQQSRRVTTCTTGKAVSDEDFDGADDGESTTILQASGRGVCCD